MTPFLKYMVLVAYICYTLPTLKSNPKIQRFRTIFQIWCLMCAYFPLNFTLSHYVFANLQKVKSYIKIGKCQVHLDDAFCFWSVIWSPAIAMSDTYPDPLITGNYLWPLCSYLLTETLRTIHIAATHKLRTLKIIRVFGSLHSSTFPSPLNEMGTRKPCWVKLNKEQIRWVSVCIEWENARCAKKLYPHFRRHVNVYTHFGFKE